MEIIIREMEEKDLDRIMEVEKGAFTTPWSRESFLLEITENKLAKYFVAEVNEVPVGYGGIWLILDEGHITNIAVDREYRGLGIGEKILKVLIDYCKEHKILAITLEVRENNQAARNLYKKHGFVGYGIRPNYYADEKQDAIVMWKNLNN